MSGDRAGKDLSQREAGRAFGNKPKATTDYEREQEAFRKNYERLKAERLAREAAAKSNDEKQR
jgi:hypothetical protein